MARHYKSKRSEVHYEKDSRPMEAAGTRYRENNNHSRSRVMMPNEPRGSFIQEDWSEPALLKRGVHEFEVGPMTNRHRAGRIGDLYAQVERTMAEDQKSFDALTDPHNW